MMLQANMFKGDKFFRAIDHNCYSAEPRIDDCDKTGVTVQALSTVPVMFNYSAKPEHTLDMSKFLNDNIADVCKKNPTRFVGLGTLPMQSTEMAIAELRRCVTDVGMCGVQIGSHINDMKLDDPKLFPIFAEAEKIGASIFVHPWDMVGIGSDKYWLPWLVAMPAETSYAICSLIFGGVMEKLPNLKFCFAHGGGSFPMTVGRVEHGFNVRPDLCAVDNNVNPREYLGKFWIDSLVHDPDVLNYNVKLMGEDRVILGSDYPFPLGEHHPGKLVESMSGWEDTRKDKILWRNGLDFLGVKEDQFLG
jgi:aminocarboxymuconate-semialdehyde decarboxylase